MSRAESRARIGKNDFGRCSVAIRRNSADGGRSGFNPKEGSLPGGGQMAPSRVRARSTPIASIVIKESVLPPFSWTQENGFTGDVSPPSERPCRGYRYLGTQAY